MSELDKAKIDFITDPNELRFHAENPIAEDGRIHVTPELLFAVADKIDGLRAEIARRDEKIARLKEDGERLASNVATIIDEDGHTWCNACKNYDVHSEYCPITLHCALMKELE